MADFVKFLIIVVGLFAVFRLLERWRRPERRMPLLRTGFKTDLAYLFFQPWIGNVVAEVLGYVALLPVILLIYGRVDEATVLAGHGPLSLLPFALQVVLILLIADFGQYWMHRALHGRRLWRFHAIHHSATELDWLAGARGHPVNEALTRFAILAPILLLGVAPAAFAAIAPVTVLFTLIQHANVDWDFGPLRHVLVSPRYHRWHHADEAEAHGKNFAGLFPLWDILFGTHYMPKDREATRFGTATPVPNGILAQLAYPFRRSSRIAAAAESRDPAQGSAPNAWF